jgi:GTPase SAR1 family protein
LEWVQFAENNCKNDFIKILVGNKLDLIEEIKITTEEGKQLKEKGDFAAFYEVSSKSGISILDMFEDVVKKFVKDQYLEIPEELSLSIQLSVELLGDKEKEERKKVNQCCV